MAPGCAYIANLITEKETSCQRVMHHQTATSVPDEWVSEALSTGTSEKRAYFIAGRGSRGPLSRVR